jgi:hypothetical protein
MAAGYPKLQESVFFQDLRRAVGAAIVEEDNFVKPRRKCILSA